MSSFRSQLQLIFTFGVLNTSLLFCWVWKQHTSTHWCCTKQQFWVHQNAGQFGWSRIRIVCGLSCGRDSAEWIGSVYLAPLPPRKLTWQWKIHHLKIYFLLNMGIFQCHVSFQGCTVSCIPINPVGISDTLDILWCLCQALGILCELLKLWHFWITCIWANYHDS